MLGARPGLFYPYSKGSNDMTVSYKDADAKMRVAMEKTASDPSINNPRAEELRRQIREAAAEELVHMAPEELRALTERTKFSEGASPFWS
jgi:hypothetical protein